MASRPQANCLCLQNGTVEDALRSRPPWRGRPPVRLAWPTRVEVGLDAAQGLLGLHKASPPLLMGALQPSDVLLSAAMDAHIAAPSPASVVHGQQVRSAATNLPTLSQGASSLPLQTTTAQACHRIQGL